MDNKTKAICIRMHDADFKKLHEDAKDFNSMTHFIMCALKEFSGKSPKYILNLRKELAVTLRSIDSKLAHAGANLNQCMRRCNELANSQYNYTEMLFDGVIPAVQTIQDNIIVFRKELDTVFDKYVK